MAFSKTSIDSKFERTYSSQLPCISYKRYFRLVIQIRIRDNRNNTAMTRARLLSLFEGLVAQLGGTEVFLRQPGIVDSKLDGLEDLYGGVFEAFEVDDLGFRMQHADYRIFLQFLVDLLRVYVVETESEEVALTINGQVWAVLGGKYKGTSLKLEILAKILPVSRDWGLYRNLSLLMATSSNLSLLLLIELGISCTISEILACLISP